MSYEDAERLGQQAARCLATWKAAIKWLDIDIRPGLTGREFTRIERTFGFEFADDHRAFLAIGLPTGQLWPDWRDGDPDDLRRLLAWPVEGFLFDVEHINEWEDGMGARPWHHSWGPQPADLQQARSVARHHLVQVAQMVPVYSHRYLPAGRGTYGHPVLSMHQTDIVYYGCDLVDYMNHEFGGPEAPRSERREATVSFWTDFVE